MKKFDKVALLEGAKEIIRTAIMAVVPLLIAQLQTGTKIDWTPIVVAGAIALLSGLDKWAHKQEIGTPLDLKGMDQLIK